jgi:hypothetical protein
LQPAVVLPAKDEASSMWNCPFCGVITEIPHETQEGCIRALHEEIARMRALLEHVHSTEVPEPDDVPADPVDPEGEPQDSAGV